MKISTLLIAALVAFVPLALWLSFSRTESMEGAPSRPDLASPKPSVAEGEANRAEVPSEPEGQSDPFLVKVEAALGPLPQLRPNYDSKGQAV